MLNKTILIVDDEEAIRTMVRRFLEKASFDVLEAENGKKALEIFKNRKDIELVLLDLMMPEMDGYEVCKEIRKDSTVPIVMLTAKDTEVDELKGFSIGADEYVTKPFSPKILIARIESILRRMDNINNEIIEYKGIILDPVRREVTVDEKQVYLSLKEFELLEYFMKNKGIALEKEKILNNVWNYDYLGDSRTIDTHVKTLRNKLEEKRELIKTVWGVGYKFE